MTEVLEGSPFLAIRQGGVVHSRDYLSLVEPPELRFGITGNRRFSGSYTASATARGPFHYAQEDYFMGDYFMGYLSKLRLRGSTTYRVKLS